MKSYIYLITVDKENDSHKFLRAYEKEKSESEILRLFGDYKVQTAKLFGTIESENSCDKLNKFTKLARKAELGLIYDGKDGIYLIPEGKQNNNFFLRKNDLINSTHISRPAKPYKAPIKISEFKGDCEYGCEPEFYESPQKEEELNFYTLYWIPFYIKLKEEFKSELKDEILVKASFLQSLNSYFYETGDKIKNRPIYHYYLNKERGEIIFGGNTKIFSKESFDYYVLPFLNGEKSPINREGFYSYYTKSELDFYFKKKLPVFISYLN